MNQHNWHQRIAVSPCSTPKWPLDECLRAFSDLGYTKFEAFSEWATSALDLDREPQFYRELLGEYDFTLSSFHLPPLGREFDESLQTSIKAARFAADLGAPVVLFKARQREYYIEGAAPFLDATQDLPVTPVLQNHYGTPITTLEDFREVLAGIADARMKTLLEVGHFHKAGVSWREGYDLLGESIALVHLKDMRDGVPVPFGTGEVDLEALLEHLKNAGYRGDFVIEMEVADRENVLQYLGDALTWLEARRELIETPTLSVA